MSFRKFSHLCSRKSSSRTNLINEKFWKHHNQVFLKKFPSVFSKKISFSKILNLRKVSQTLIWWILEVFTNSGVLENMSSTKFLYKNFEIMLTYVSFEILSFQRCYLLGKNEKQQSMHRKTSNSRISKHEFYHLSRITKICYNISCISFTP